MRKIKIFFCISFLVDRMANIHVLFQKAKVTDLLSC